MSITVKEVRSSHDCEEAIDRLIVQLRTEQQRADDGDRFAIDCEYRGVVRCRDAIRALAKEAK